MEDHPRKRRKTSPLTSVTLNVSNTPTRAASEDGSRSTPARASFISPTKASLARFNPHLLPRLESAERKQEDQASRQSPVFGEKKRPGPDVGGKSVDDASTVLQQKIQPVKIIGDSQKSIEGEATAPLGFDTAPNGDGFHSCPRRSRTPLMEPLNAMELQPTVEQDRRASLDAIGDEQQIFLDSVPLHNASGSRGSISEHINPTIDTIENDIEQAGGPDPVPPFTPTKNVLEDAEPRLPPTPSQLGLEAPASSPKGLAFSRPSRKSKKKKLSEVKSSPLKPRVSSPAMKPAETTGLGPRIPVTIVQQSTTTQPEKQRKETDRAYVVLDNAVFSLSWG